VSSNLLIQTQCEAKWCVLYFDTTDVFSIIMLIQ